MTPRAVAPFAFALLLAGCSSPHPQGIYPFEPALPAPDVVLTAEAGRTFTFAESDGRAKLVTFGYTTCPDVCPTTLADWTRVKRTLAADAAKVRFVFVSADWRHDTPDGAAAFARGFDPAFEGATADSAGLRRLLPAFKAEAGYGKPSSGAAGGFAHTDYVYLVDGRGRVRTACTFQTSPGVLAKELRRLLAER